MWGYTQEDSRRTRREAGRTTLTTTERSHVAARCGACGALSIAIVTGLAAKMNGNGAAEADRILRDSGHSITWYPVSVLTKEFSDVPQHVARCATEAYTALGVGANIAAILMARTTIEATAKSQEITKGRLIAKIDEMAKQSLIRPALKTAAHAIRSIGNDMAHGDVEEPPTQQEAEDVLLLMSMILTEVFEAAALTQSLLARNVKQAPPTEEVNETVIV